MELCKVQLIINGAYICILLAVVVAAVAGKPELASHWFLRCGVLAMPQRQSKKLHKESSSDLN